MNEADLIKGVNQDFVFEYFDSGRINYAEKYFFIYNTKPVQKLQSCIYLLTPDLLCGKVVDIKQFGVFCFVLFFFPLKQLCCLAPCFRNVNSIKLQSVTEKCQQPWFRILCLCLSKNPRKPGWIDQISLLLIHVNTVVI